MPTVSRDSFGKRCLSDRLGSLGSSRSRFTRLSCSGGDGGREVKAEYAVAIEIWTDECLCLADLDAEVAAERGSVDEFVTALVNDRKCLGEARMGGADADHGFFSVKKEHDGLGVPEHFVNIAIHRQDAFPVYCDMNSLIDRSCRAAHEFFPVFDHNLSPLFLAFVQACFISSTKGTKSQATCDDTRVTGRAHDSILKVRPQRIANEICRRARQARDICRC